LSSEKNKTLLFLKKKKQKDFKFWCFSPMRFVNINRRGFLRLGVASLAGVGAAAPLPGVRLNTPFGPVVIALDIARAPLSAGAFLACVDAGGYGGGHFTRVVRPENDHGKPPISVVQGAARDGVKAPPVAHESTRQTGLKHLDGTVSLPRDAVGSATGAEFFICVGDQPGLDYGAHRNADGQGFAAFGRVVAGMNVVRRIWGMHPGGASPDAYTAGQMLMPPVAILSAQRLA
jgi:peptidyl-prolyl cis-trans isomerase A (cyclophilin A)